MVGRFEMPARAYLGRFNFKGADQQKKVGTLSGGERGRLHLAKTLLGGANVLLLDEPSNDLDVETLRALEDALGEFAGTVLVISHDRWFLDRIATHILAFEGDSSVYFFEGNYQEYEANSIEPRPSPSASKLSVLSSPATTLTTTGTSIVPPGTGSLKVSFHESPALGGTPAPATSREIWSKRPNSGTASSCLVATKSSEPSARVFARKSKSSPSTVTAICIVPRGAPRKTTAALESCVPAGVRSDVVQR
jgi:energy-coupling factor transporter ATP-binding protein EcfA2